MESARLLSDAELKSLSIKRFKPKNIEDYKKIFHLNRPELEESSVSFYSLPETNQIVTNFAIGICVGENTVTVCQAVIDLEKALGPDQFRDVFTTSMESQQDVFGVMEKDTCKFHATCRRGDTCTFYHGRHGEKRYRAHQFRATPAQLKKAGDNKKGPGFSTEYPSFAVVLTQTFPRSGNNIDWGKPQQPSFSRASVTLAGLWDDELIEDMIDKEGEIEDLDEDSNEANTFVFREFCKHFAVSTGGGETITSICGNNLLVSTTPPIEHHSGDVTIRGNSRTFMNTRRFLLDTCISVFNRVALTFLSQNASDVCVFGRQSKPIPAAVLQVLNKGGLSVPHRCLSASVVKTPMFGPPSCFLQEFSQKNPIFAEAKFNTPLKEFSSLYNLRLLTNTLDGLEPYQLSQMQQLAASERLLSLLEFERNKILVGYAAGGYKTVSLAVGDTQIIFSENLGIATHPASSPGVVQVEVNPVECFGSRK